MFLFSIYNNKLLKSQLTMTYLLYVYKKLETSMRTIRHIRYLIVGIGHFHLSNNYAKTTHQMQHNIN